MIEVTYYTVSDEQFFLGSVMLFNSLHLTKNVGDLVVLDVGLTHVQRDLLEEHMTVVSSSTLNSTQHMTKPYPYLLRASGTIVAIDSDIVVTGSLEPIIDLARAGKICACPAWTTEARTRWFPEWQTMLHLQQALRRAEWFHGGFVAFGTDHWPQLLERWWNVCQLTPNNDVFVNGTQFKGGDADALNALMMSEIPREALVLLPEGDEAFGGHLTIEDLRTLKCNSDGRRTRLVHYPDRPKPWSAAGWLRVGAREYARIISRLLLSEDLPLRLQPDQLPLWLRPTRPGRLIGGTAAVMNRLVVTPAYKAPDPIAEWLRRFRRWAT